MRQGNRRQLGFGRFGPCGSWAKIVGKKSAILRKDTKIPRFLSKGSREKVLLFFLWWFAYLPNKDLRSVGLASWPHRSNQNTLSEVLPSVLDKMSYWERMSFVPSWFELVVWSKKGSHISCQSAGNCTLGVSLFTQKSCQFCVNFRSRYIGVGALPLLKLSPICCSKWHLTQFPTALEVLNVKKHHE